MIRHIILLGLLCLSIATYAQKPQHYYVHIKTNKGDAVLKLYNETPLHRDNFYKLVKEGYYDSLLFHRVIKNFMIQGGDPESRHAADRTLLGNGGPEYKVPAEIRTDIIHKRGSIAAARNNNPEKASSGSQFYLVQGRKFTEKGLDSLETYRFKSKKLSSLQRRTYTEIGGAPHLDGEYTVFGELLSGIEIIDKIAAVPTDGNDRPLTNVRMAMQLLTRREALNLEREMQGLQPKNGFFTKIGDALKSRYYTL